MTLAEEQTERRWIDGFLLIVLDRTITHQGRQQIDAVPGSAVRGFRFLLQQLATLFARMIQVLASAEIIARGESLQASGGARRDVFTGELARKKQPWPHR